MRIYIGDPNNMEDIDIRSLEELKGFALGYGHGRVKLDFNAILDCTCERVPSIMKWNEEDRRMPQAKAHLETDSRLTEGSTGMRYV